MHLREEVQDQEHILYNLFKTVFEEEKSPIKNAKIEHLEQFYGHEVASIFKKQVAKKKWYNRATEESLKMWARRDRLNVVSQQMLINKCQFISNGILETSVEDLLRQLSNTNQQQNDDLIVYWKSKTIQASEDIFKVFYSASDIALEQKDYTMALRFYNFMGKIYGLTESRTKEKYMETVLLKSTSEHSRVLPENSFRAIFKNFKLISGCYDKAASNKQVAVLKYKHLRGMSTVAKKGVWNGFENFCNQFIGVQYNDRILHFKNLLEGQNITSQKDLCCALEKLALYYLKDFRHALNSSELFELSEAIYNLLQEFPETKSIDMLKTIVDSHTSSMKQGSVKAMKMFPKLLLLMEDNCHDTEVVLFFQSKMSNVPSWTILPWCSQLLGMYFVVLHIFNLYFSL